MTNPTTEGTPEPVTRSRTSTNVGLLLFAVLVVAGPYSFFIHKACGSSSLSEVDADIGAFHSHEGC